MAQPVASAQPEASVQPEADGIVPAEPSVPTPAAPSTVLQELRDDVLAGPYGTAPIEEVLRIFRETPGGPEVQEILNALAVRKDDALPIIRERLLTGDWYERHLLTKLLRYSPWPEAFDELLLLAQNTEPQHYLGRQGALYALAALGNPAAGPVVAAILRDSEARPDTRLVAMATLGRIGYRDALPDIRPLAESGPVVMRVFANHTLALLGLPVDTRFLISATNDPDSFLRGEALTALAHVPGNAIDAHLHDLAQNDPSQAVRGSAILALLQRELHNRNNAERLLILDEALPAAGRHTAVGILSLMLDKCGSEGRAHLAAFALQDNEIGERSATLLLRAGAPNP